MRFKGLGFGAKGLRDIEFRNGKERTWKDGSWMSAGMNLISGMNRI